MRSVKVGLNEKWYLGLDIGTNSVGFCATNASYDILTKGNKLQAGARLFEEAHDASTRRVKRSIRRQRARLRNRIDMLQAIFADNIDDKFFLSLNESRLYLDDKTVKNKYTLFNDSDFTDVDFYKKFPTIYHLRQYLLTTPAPDIRLLYLVCHHMMKNRGHFLFQEFNPKQSSSNIQSIIESINDGIKKVFSDSNDAVNLKLLSTDNIEQKFAEAKKIKRETDCWSKLAEILNPAKDSLLTKIFKIVKGDKISLNVFNPENTNEACEEILGSDILKKLKFKEATFDENFAKVTDSGLLTDDQISLIVHCKELYDCIKLNLILDGAETISEAMLKRYNNHKNDLRVLKSFVKNNYPESYSDLFRDTNKDAKFATYTNYVKSSISNNKKVVSYCQRCVSAIPKEDRKNVLVTSEYDSFIKTVKSLIESKGLAESAKESEEYKYIKAKLDENTFCKKLRTIDNAYFPNQLNAYELRKILLTQQTLFPDFLTDDVIEKIIKLLTFRIPYYVGPLSDLHDKFSWVKRTTPHSTTPITPFNFNEEIDEFATGEAFITRMISKCTYLKNEYVLPKQSILYQEYMVLNELNNLKINGNRITQDIKEFLYKDVCLRKSNITKSVLIKSLKNAGKITDNDTLGKGDDLDPGFKSSLSSLISCKNILGVKYDQNLTTNQLLMCENIIRYLTVFGDEKQPVKERIDKEYGSILTEDQIEKFLNLSCAAWGRLSRKFLSGIKTTELKAPLNEVSIIDILKNTTMNLMEILNSNYYAESFIDIVRNINNEQDGNNQITYDDVNNLYCSPAVKRAIWQAYLITDELVKINKTPPAGVFIEVTRSEDIAKKKKLQSSRKQVIEELIKNIKSDPKYDGYAPDKLNNELTKLTNDKLRSDKIFFYFMQLGRCMYSGEPIDLDELLNNNNKYDIDHIYPQCQILDDSLSNRVLVYRSENLKKGKNYPIANSVRDKMIRFWNLLHAKKFIDDKKLQRLKSASPISESEIAAFNNRQLVNTSQAAKCVAEILQKKFQSSKTKIVYSKAEVVSRFRQLMKIVKCRFINNIHHAHDAYLNIVVGNVWYQMFTNRAVSGSDRYANLYMQYFQKNKIDLDASDSSNETISMINDGRDFVIRKIFLKFNIEGVWKTEYMSKVKSYTINCDEKYINKFSISRMPHDINSGAFYDETTHIKFKDIIPIKSNISTEKYGGYRSCYSSHIALVEYYDEKKKVNIKEFVAVPIMINQYTGESYLRKICEYNNIPNNPENNVRIIYDKILADNLIEIDSTRYHIAKADLSCVVASEWYPSGRTIKLLKHFSKYMERVALLKDDKDKKKVEVANYSLAESEIIYKEVLKQLSKPFYKRYVLAQKILDGRINADKFYELSLLERSLVIGELISFINNDKSLSDMTLIGGKKNESIKWLDPMKQVEKEKLSINLITQSPTGLFEKSIPLI